MGKKTDQNILNERKRIILSGRTLLLTVLSVLILAILISRLDVHKTLNTFLTANIFFLAMAICLYFISNFFKTLRFKVLLSQYDISTGNLYRIVSYHNFFNQIFPARTGELTLIYYLNKHADIKSSKGLHVLLAARIFDLIIVSIFFILSVLIYQGMHSSIILLVIGIIVALLSIILLFNINTVITFCIRLVILLFKGLRIEKKKFPAYITGKLQSVSGEFSDYTLKRNIPMLALTSLLVWITLHLFSYITFYVFSINIQLLQSVIGSTGAILTNVLPINSFGSFGTMEAGWTGGFMFVGLSKQDAITTAFGYHFINFIASGIMAFICFVLFSYLRKKRQKK